MKYSEKLLDPRWQRKRLEIMQRDDFTCLACGDKETTLNVHHLQYAGNPWEANNESLETLCEPCHKKRSEINKRFFNIPTRDALKLNFVVTGAGEPIYNKQLMCRLIRAVICLNAVHLYIPEFNEPDMSGAIAYCMEINKDVSCIEVFSGSRMGDGYKKVNGIWELNPIAGRV